MRVHLAPLGLAVTALLLRLGCASAGAATPAPMPTGANAMAGSSSATVRWTAPATVDSAPVKSFTVTASTGQSDFQALSYLNRWLIGRYINDLARRTPSTCPRGWFAPTVRTLWPAEWSLAGGAGGLGQVSLVSYQVLRGGIPVQDVPSPGRTQPGY